MDLKVQRIRSGLKQREIAVAIGVSRSWVAKVERMPTVPAAAAERYSLALRTFALVRTTEAA